MNENDAAARRGTPSSRLSVIALVAANLLIAIFALTRQWGYLYLLLVYWWEAVIIGGFNLLRMFVSCMFGNPLGDRVGFSGPLSRFLLAAVLGGFFVVKFGGFALGLVLGILILSSHLEMYAGPNSLDGVVDSLSAIGNDVLWVVLLLVASHGISFFRNYIGRGEYKHRNVIGLMFWPYVRLVLIVIVLALGLGAVYLFPGFAAATVFTVFIVICKLVVDLITHRVEHSRFGKS